jgi:putative acetyltransferase
MIARSHERRRTADSPVAASPARNSPQTQTVLRRYRADDEDAAIALWLRTWRAAYPQLDFAARLDGWRQRWRSELVPVVEIVIAEHASDRETAMIGFLTVDPRTGYLDQIVVAPERWGLGVGAALIDEARKLSPSGLDLDVNTDNARAIRFYRKEGFAIRSTGINPTSQRPVYRMSWRP